MANILIRKIQLVPIGDKDEIDRVYKYIRDGQYSQYLGLNRLMSELVMTFYQNNRQLNDVFKEKQKAILTNTNTMLDDIDFAVGCDSKSQIIQKVKSDFTQSIKNGLARGEVSVTNYKRTNSLLVRGRDLKLEHSYGDINELDEHLFSTDFEIRIKFVNRIKFKIILSIFLYNQNNESCFFFVEN